MSDQHSPQERSEGRWTIREEDGGRRLVADGYALPRDPITGKREILVMRVEEHLAILVDARAALQDREAELREAAQIAVEDQSRQRSKAEARANRAEAALREAREEVERVAKQLWRDSQRDTTIIRDAGYMQDAAEKLEALDTSIEDREPEEQQQVGERCGGSGRVLRPVANAGNRRADGSLFQPGDLGYVNGDGEMEVTCSGCPDCKPPAPCSDRASTQGGDASAGGPGTVELQSTGVTGGEPEPDDGLAPETSTRADSLAALLSKTLPFLPDGAGHPESLQGRVLAALGDCAEPSSSDQEAMKVVVDFLNDWRFCPVSTASAPPRSCLEDAATQLLAALDAIDQEETGHA